MLSLLEKYNKLSWAFVIIIAAAIFYMSSLTFPPGPPATNINATLYHFFAFFFLAFFLLPALIKGKNKHLLTLAIILAILYSLSDEIHQLFVPGRVFAPYDIMVNSFGILSASFIYTLSLRFRSKGKVEREFIGDTPLIKEV